MSLTANVNSPMLFRQWAAIALVGGAVERRVWMTTSQGVAFHKLCPNLYVMLVAPPGVGKAIVEFIRELWREARVPNTKLAAFKVAPDNMTKAALIDRLSKSKQTFLPPKGKTMEFHSLLVAAEEFGVLLPAWDNEFLGTLNKIYNNPPSYSEERRHGPAQEITFDAPCLNIFGGVQPGWLGNIMPEEAWNMGFMSRMLLIYSGKGIEQDLFSTVQYPMSLHKKIVTRLEALSTAYGAMQWSPEVIAELEQWYDQGRGCKPVPEHSKLAYYNNRRPLHVMKLAMISSLARNVDLIVQTYDLKRAWAWLFEAEKHMPDIFREMTGKSDTQVIEELHFFLTQEWSRHNGKPVHEAKLFDFLRARVPSDKLEKIMQIAERSNVIVRMANTQTYIPRAKHMHGVE